MTYKYQQNTSILERRPEKKLRAPAWCDRVLWRTKRLGVRLEAYGSFRLSIEAGEGVDVERDGIPLSLLEREATALIQERGYSAGDDRNEPVELRLTATPERVVRRTWSADPGYNGYVEREREEGVLSIVATDPIQRVELWRGMSRVRLPDSGRVVGPSRETAWMHALVELIARMPARRSE